MTVRSCDLCVYYSAILCSFESIIYLLSCLETCCDPAVPSSPVYDASTDAKCTVERQGSRNHYYAVLAMTVLWSDTKHYCIVLIPGSDSMIIPSSVFSSFLL